MHKIAIDIGPLFTGDSVRGIGTYVRELKRRLNNVDFVDVSKINLSDYDLIHLTRFNPFRLSVPLYKPHNTKFILTIYDLIPLIYPKNYPPGIRGKINWYLNKLLILKNVDLVITISETSKKDICRFTGISPNRVFVTYLSSPAIFRKLKRGSWEKNIRKKYNLPDKFVLYVGDINFNKNIPMLVKACRMSGLKLVICGKQAREAEKLDLSHPELRHLKNVDWSDVLRLGFVEDEDLVKICNLGDVYVQPSLYEGFGIPPLQAYKCGTPIVLAKNQCHVEIFGDDFVYFNPMSIDDMLRKLANPNKKKDIARSYSWENTAKSTEMLYKHVLVGESNIIAKGASSQISSRGKERVF